MKKFIVLLMILSNLMLFGQGFPVFNIEYVNDYYTITCAVKEVSVNVTTTYTGQITYNWVGPNYTATGAAVTMTAPGNYSLVVTTGTISTNLFVPVLINTVTPVCSSSMTFAQSGTVALQAFTFTAVSPTVNLTHYIYRPGDPVPVTSGGIYAIYIPESAGTYTHCMVDNVNGCSTCTLLIIPSLTVGTTATFLKEIDLTTFQSFPNPTTGVFKITPADTDISLVKVSNVAGEQVEVNYVLGPELSVDLGEAPKGIYVVHLIKRNGKTSMIKLVKD